MHNGGQTKYAWSLESLHVEALNPGFGVEAYFCTVCERHESKVSMTKSKFRKGNMFTRRQK